MDANRIEQLIRAAMPDAQIEVSSPDNVHFHARIVSGEFSGQPRLARHRRIHTALGPTLGREIHALSLDLKSPDE